MSPEVQASIIRAASDWAMLLMKASSPKKPLTASRRLTKAFAISYKAIAEVVEAK